MKFATKVHVTVELSDGSRYVQTAARPEVTMGRDLTGFDHYFSSISIDDPGVSREHARLLVDADGTLSVEDLGSRNGTFVGGRRLDRGAVERLGADGKLSLLPIAGERGEMTRRSDRGGARLSLTSLCDRDAYAVTAGRRER